MGHQAITQRSHPIPRDDEARDDVRQQREREQLQHRRVIAIGDEDFERQHANREEHDQRHERNAWDEELCGDRHRAQVGADVDGVGDQDQGDRGKQDFAAVVLAHDTRDPPARHQADASTHLLHDDHQGQDVDHEPELTGAEGGARLRIGGDAGGIVIRGSRDQARPQHTQSAVDVAEWSRLPTVRQAAPHARNSRRSGGHGITVHFTGPAGCPASSDRGGMRSRPQAAPSYD